MHQDSSLASSNRRISQVWPAQATAVAPLREAFERSPAQQSDRAQYKAPNHNFVLIAVALEAHGEYVVLGRILAKWDALLEAEGLVSIVSKKGSDRFDWCSGPRGIIVLFLKHVHLQKGLQPYLGVWGATAVDADIWLAQLTPTPKKLSSALANFRSPYVLIKLSLFPPQEKRTQQTPANMNPAMPRISWVRGIQSLHRATSRRTTVAPRHISTTPVACSTKNTEWVRSKLWKDGDAPGAADPYTQRPDEVPEDSPVTRLPRAALEGSSDAADKRPYAVRSSRLPFPAARNEAATIKEAGANDPNYQPAETLAELAEAATLSEWWDQPGHWSELDQFAAFASPEKVTDKAAIEVYYRRALVEALALQETGALGEWATQKWAEGSREDLDAALAVEIVAQDGGLLGPLSWKDIAVNDQIKFALRKRLYQLTGNLIPDAKLGAATTVGHLITLTAKQPKAKRLAEILQKTEELQQLANVRLHDRRVSSIDREIAVGRWKLIEEELAKRDLPITGLADVSKNLEREHLLGKI
ncbi:hypothetical protein NLG97_g1778 [Lecanicillium saksenae]|uniref:Uncharacterized protein n=1 Tax=Lecanicillium saksenae TaxID=468837 RepID=A0ACC1R679_9HYPO|nr:hypothetical protein NLG97_g1778 [Lecanicillium saksenae]